MQFQPIAEAPLTFADKVFIESELRNGRTPEVIHNGVPSTGGQPIGTLYGVSPIQEYGASGIALCFAAIILVAYLFQVCKKYYQKAKKKPTGLSIDIEDSEWSNQS